MSGILREHLKGISRCGLTEKNEKVFIKVYCFSFASPCIALIACRIIQDIANIGLAMEQSDWLILVIGPLAAQNVVLPSQNHN